jgi:hypothetical protein
LIAFQTPSKMPDRSLDIANAHRAGQAAFRQLRAHAKNLLLEAL